MCKWTKVSGCGLGKRRVEVKGVKGSKRLVRESKRR